MERANNKLVLLARNYAISTESAQLLRAAHPLIICGVTAAGKNATCNYLEERSNYERVVTHTTRLSRQDEEQGKDYWFASENDMLQLVQSQAFIEVEVLNGDRVYGVSRRALELVISHGKRPILAIDIQSAAKIAGLLATIQPLFMVPPSSDIWMQRLGGRSYMSDGEHDRRLHGAYGELEFAFNNSDFTIVVNHDIEQSAAEILRGVPSDSGTQTERRALVKELMEFARSSNI